MAIFKCAGRERFDEEGIPYCDYEDAKPWRGRCPGCGRFYDCDKIGADKINKPLATAGQSAAAKIEHVPTGIVHLDYVLGGGFVRKKLVLFGGPKGTGKSTLMLMVEDALARRLDKKVLYASAEELTEAVLQMCNRFKIENDNLAIMGKELIPDVHSVIEKCREMKPAMVVFDSLQRMPIEGMGSSTLHDLTVVEAIAKYCHHHPETFVVIMNHMNKSMDFVGGTGIGHDIDTELMIYNYTPEDDGQPRELFSKEVYEAPDFILKDLRTLTTGKNRGGEGGRKSYFLMQESGLKPLTMRSPDDPKPTRRSLRAL